MVYPFGSRDVKSAHNREIKRLANVGINVFGHRMMKIWHPVRSALNKHHIAWLVLQWVTMWESQVLNSTFSFLLPQLPLPPLRACRESRLSSHPKRFRQQHRYQMAEATKY